jgi:hypothetical protein
VFSRWCSLLSWLFSNPGIKEGVVLRRCLTPWLLVARSSVDYDDDERTWGMCFPGSLFLNPLLLYHLFIIGLSNMIWVIERAILYLIFLFLIQFLKFSCLRVLINKQVL